MSGFFNLIKHGPAVAKGVKTAIAPIKHAANVIKTTFKPKTKKPKIGGTEKSDQIKKSNKILKELDKTMQKNLTPKLQAQGEKLKKEVKETQKKIYKTDFKKGGRAGFKKGSKDPVGKKKSKFPDFSGDGEVTQKDILMAKGVIPKPKNKKKVI